MEAGEEFGVFLPLRKEGREACTPVRKEGEVEGEEVLPHMEEQEQQYEELTEVVDRWV